MVDKEGAITAMDIKRDGVVISVDVTKQSNEWFIATAQELAEAARERGLELSPAMGGVALEAARQDESKHVEVLSDHSDVRESLLEQLGIAHVGYKAVLDNLNEGSAKKSKMELASSDELAAEFNEWLTPEAVAYVAAVQEKDPEVTFTVVATPNVSVGSHEITKAAKVFGKDQPYNTNIDNSFYAEYSSEQLSGTDPDNGNKVQFSLVPSKFTPELELCSFSSFFFFSFLVFGSGERLS